MLRPLTDPCTSVSICSRPFEEGRVPRQMFLRAPQSGQTVKPNRSNKGAFTGKAAPKIKKWQSPEQEGEESAAKAQKIECEFVAWMRNQKTSGAWHVEAAKDYLLEGLPWKGDSTYDAKQVINDLGSKWMRNPGKDDGCQDRSIRRGWAVAYDPKVMLQLLLLAKDGRGRRQWACLELVETQQLQIIAWLRQYFDTLGVTVDAPQVVQDTESTCMSGNSDSQRMTKSNPSSDHWKGVPQWIIDANANHVPTWVPDTVCVVCKRPVDDQFMDCACTEARWSRCSKCCEKYRTDFVKGGALNDNAWCKCGHK